jgi:hypothetical protein
MLIYGVFDDSSELEAADDSTEGAASSTGEAGVSMADPSW